MRASIYSTVVLVMHSFYPLHALVLLVKNTSCTLESLDFGKISRLNIHFHRLEFI